MRMTLIAGAALLGGLLTASSAMAAPDWSSMTCADYLKLDQSSQASIAAQVGPADLAQSQTSNSASAMTSANTPATGTGATDHVVDPGQLASACQASPSSTVHDLVSRPGAINSSTSN